MPLVIDKDLPSIKALEKERIFIIDSERAKAQDIRPIKIAILNLMPNKEETEIQILRALSNTPLQVEIDLIKTESYQAKNTSEKYLKRYYKNFSEIKNEKYDGMIITGAPVEKLDFEEVKYWQELTEIFDYARTNVYSTMFICWASQAALNYYYGVEKHLSPKKIFGVYEYEVQRGGQLTKGFDDYFYMPQSRHALNRQEDIEKIGDLKIIGSDEETGVSLVTSLDNRFVFVSGHGEYDKDSLYKEYLRDKKLGLDIDLPINYFRNDDPEEDIIVRWRSHANLLFTNWLNYFVYQETPYDISKIEKKIVLKFGGSSLSDSDQFVKVRDIVLSEGGRNFVVVSAPGRRHEGDIKVTDLLLGFYECRYEDEKENLLEIIRARYYNIVRDLNLGRGYYRLIDETLDSMKDSKSRDFVISRGEYLSALLMAEYLSYKFLDAQELIFFEKGGSLDKIRTHRAINEKISQGDRVVIPGFYGLDDQGQIKTFDRGGSDITGSLVAWALKSDVYENWTDVDGLMEKDPRKHSDAKLIDSLSYDDFLKISSQSDQVYHYDAIEPVMQGEIPIRIRNTNNPSSEGTIIGGLEDREES